MSESEFRTSTPAKLFKLLSIHQEINSPKEEQKSSSKVEEKYIDQISF
jgi:hypothetical protein